jgi:transposase
LEILQEDPHALGYASGTWTVANVANHLSERHGILVGEHTLRRRMKELGLRYKRPKYVYEEKEPNLAQKKGPSSVS